MFRSATFSILFGILKVRWDGAAPAGSLPGRSRTLLGCSRTSPKRSRTPPGAHVPAKRPTIVQKVAMMVFCKAPIGHTDLCPPPGRSRAAPGGAPGRPGGAF